MAINGIHPVMALRSAPGVSAELLQQDDMGILAPGRKADINVVPGNPYLDITVTEREDFVMKGETVMKRNGTPVQQI